MKSLLLYIWPATGHCRGSYYTFGQVCNYATGPFGTTCSAENSDTLGDKLETTYCDLNHRTISYVLVKELCMTVD